MCEGQVPRYVLMNIVELETDLTRLGVVRSRTERDAALRFNVLLADDSVDDHFFLRRALDKSHCLHPVAEVFNGLEVMEYLSGEGIYADRSRFPFPSLLLLDTSMPRMGGLEVLAWLQKQKYPDLRVVMLSGSLEPRTIKEALSLGADYYQAKTFEGEQMTALVRRLELLMVLMHRREPNKIMDSHYDSDEGVQAYTTLKIVDGRTVDCREALAKAADSRRNFIFIVKDEQGLEKLWSVLGTTNVMPERVHRWGILAMAEALQTRDYANLLDIHGESAVYLVEQLALNRNVPPRTKRYMLYCELRGIISDHNTIEEAGILLLSYLNFFKRARLLPLAGIYEYADEKWVRVKKLSSGDVVL